jgi:CHAT domain-containing protein
MSEMEQSKFWSTFQFSINLFYEFAYAHPKQTGVAEAVLDLQLNTKGMLLNNSRRIRESILTSENTGLIQKFGQWQMAKEELSGYYTLSKEDLAFEEIDLQQYELDVNQMEQELVRESNVFSSGLTKKPIDWKEIQKQLSEKEFALEIVRAAYTYGASKKMPIYFSIIIGHNGLPQLVNMNNGKELEGKYFSFYKNSIQNKLSDAISYQKYWGPLSSILASASRIYVSPDGIYNNISLMTLQQSSRFLLDEKEIVMVPSLKSLVKETSKSKIAPHKSLLLGNPAYGNTEKLVQLPGTEREVKEIYQVLTDASRESRVLRGDSATESALKAEVSPEILHVATHGYFLDDVSSSTSTRSVMGVQISNAKEHPLLRSGLMLAGGAQAMDSELLFERKDNGILTAFEALNMNLEGTRLVVLSACETGLGKLVNGEGVYGLSRSFMVAGSQAVIMSLWKVDDQSTQLLMSTFYKIWLQTNQLESSFVQAQKAVKDKYPEPYYWGAFVLLGN